MRGREKKKRWVKIIVGQMINQIIDTTRSFIPWRIEKRGTIGHF